MGGAALHLLCVHLRLFQRSKSMWRAYREKKAAKLHHASNYQTGFIDVNEHHLNRTGIRGRKRGCTWCCVAALLFVSLANLVVRHYYYYAYKS